MVVLLQLLVGVLIVVSLAFIWYLGYKLIMLLESEVYSINGYTVLLLVAMSWPLILAFCYSVGSYVYDLALLP